MLHVTPGNLCLTWTASTAAMFKKGPAETLPASPAKEENLQVSYRATVQSVYCDVL